MIGDVEWSVLYSSFGLIMIDIACILTHQIREDPETNTEWTLRYYKNQYQVECSLPLIELQNE